MNTNPLLSTQDIIDLAAKLEKIEYNTPFVLSENGGWLPVIIDTPLPEAVRDEDDSWGVRLDDLYPVKGKEWNLIHGMSAQYSYNGASMHPSEFIGRGMAEEMLRLSEGDPQVFLILEINEDELGSWCIAYRAI